MHAALLIPVLTTAAVACVLGPIPTVLDEYNAADVVMIARVVSLKKSTEFDPGYFGDVRSATFIVEKVFKGDVKVQDQLVFGQGNGVRCMNPMNLICVSLIPTDREHYGGCSALTDEKGRFKIDGVEAGSYFLMLNNDDKMNPKKLPRLYYQNVRTTENARRFTIRHGESLRNLNFRFSTSDLKGP